ncbi:MAG: hypothetical protein NTZ01_05920 [Verrucomicrobia bacterium]|nr:hypothetical protein [Verrucomicrobiota bacterium]
MQTTLRINDQIYRNAKAEAARKGVTMTKFLEEALQLKMRQNTERKPAQIRGALRFETPAWFGSLKKYAKTAKGKHDMESIRQSIGRGIGRERA